MPYAPLVPTKEQMTSAIGTKERTPASIGHCFLHRSELRRLVAPKHAQQKSESSAERSARHLNSVLGPVRPDGKRDATKATAEIHFAFCHLVWTALENEPLALHGHGEY
jgi:hypothetical protein